MTDTDARTVIEYGVETANGRTVLLVTDEVDEAQKILEVVGEGRILQRTVQYGRWHPVDLMGRSLPAVAG
jgi:hypothetical protein